jgi:hypothetical protein
MFQTSTANVAVETGLYDISDESGERSIVVEEHLTTIEGPAMAALHRIDQTGQPPSVGMAEREALCRYLGLQSTRTPETRERIFFSRRVADYAGDREITKELVAEYLETVHLGFRPAASEISAAFDFVTVNLGAPETLTPEFAIRMMLESMEKIAPVLDRMWWTVESDRKERLITSDAPLIIWRKPSPRDEYGRGRRERGGDPVLARPRQATRPHAWEAHDDGPDRRGASARGQRRRRLGLPSVRRGTPEEHRRGQSTGSDRRPSGHPVQLRAALHRGRAPRGGSPPHVGTPAAAEGLTVVRRVRPHP